MAKNCNRSASRLYPWPKPFNNFINDLFLFIETTALSSNADNVMREKMVNSFVNPHFPYSPLMWMCTSKVCNKRIDRTHERSLRLRWLTWLI